jgi:hypothetical protein
MPAWFSRAIEMGFKDKDLLQSNDRFDHVKDEPDMMKVLKLLGQSNWKGGKLDFTDSNSYFSR